MQTVKSDRYIEGIGRRKNAIARVRLTKANKNSLLINEKNLEQYFVTRELQHIVTEALKNGPLDTSFAVSARVSGGGINAQAEAIRHGVARALILIDGNLRTTLKQAGFLKRDPRAKERKKFGLKKARKAPQWSKR